ncbi:MAG: hypothetical protein RLZZ248_1018 [Bacteroidota bacterium]
MKNLLSVSLLLVLVFNFSCTAAAQWPSQIKGEGPLIRKTLELQDINAFSLMISGNVYLMQGSSQLVEVEGQANIIDVLNTEVDNQLWKIKFEERVRNISQFNIYITVPDLEEITVSGSGDVKGRGNFKASGNLDIIISGSGNVEMDLQCANLRSRVSGSGDIELSGNCDEADISISGSGSIGGNDFNSKDASVLISGSGDVNLNVESYLDVSISGSGDVTYGGQPKVKSRISGSGGIEHKAF